MFVHTLTDDARSLLGGISRSRAAAGFYLAGGSAVALHLGHRVSVDLDFFTELEGARIASLTDIALMKIVAIGQRGKMRDFVDLHAICSQGYLLEDLLHRLPRKYPDLTYPSYHILRSLVYFDDAERDVPPRMITHWVWGDVKTWFERNVKDLMGGLLA